MATVLEVPKINTYLQLPRETKTWPMKTLLICFKIIEIFFCLNLGFVDYKRPNIKRAVKYLIRFYVLTIFMASIVCIYFYFKVLIFRVVFLVVEYGLLMTVLLRNKYKMYDIFRELEIVDSQLNIDSGMYRLHVKFLTPLIFDIIIRIVLCAFYCSANECENVYWLCFVFIYVTVAINVILIMHSFMFYSVYLRLSTLRNKLVDINLGLGLFMYKSIVETAEKLKRSFDPVITIALLFNIPRIMVTIYFVLQKIQDHAIAPTLTHVVVENCAVAVTFAMTIMPPLFAEQLPSQAYRIKVVLHNKLLLEQDHSKLELITKFINYVEARPMVFRTYKIIPLNADLLGMVLNFCATYLIVIIQFSHIY